MMTVTVTATTTHRTLFMIVTKKEMKQFFLFNTILDIKFSGYKKFWTLIFSDISFVQISFCAKFFALDVSRCFFGNFQIVFANDKGF